MKEQISHILRFGELKFGIGFEEILFAVGIPSGYMAKLYWKVKRDGKWQWSPVNSETTQGDFDQIEYIGGDCESGITRMRTGRVKSSKPEAKKKPSSSQWKNCFSARFCDSCGEKSRHRLTATNPFECQKCSGHFEQGSKVVFQHYCEECFSENPTEIFTPVVNHAFESWCSSCFTIGGKKSTSTKRKR